MNRYLVHALEQPPIYGHASLHDTRQLTRGSNAAICGTLIKVSSHSPSTATTCIYGFGRDTHQSMRGSNEAIRRKLSWTVTWFTLFALQFDIHIGGRAEGAGGQMPFVRPLLAG